MGTQSKRPTYASGPLTVRGRYLTNADQEFLDHVEANPKSTNHAGRRRAKALRRRIGPVMPKFEKMWMRGLQLTLPAISSTAWKHESLPCLPWKSAV